MRKPVGLVVLAAIIAAGFNSNVRAAVAVLTSQYDNTRDGANTNEIILTPANVNTNTFGKVFTYSVDGNVYAEPLVMTNVTIPGKGTHNILIVATENDTVYAFDADNFVSTPYWSTSFINPGAGVTVVTGGFNKDLPSSNIQPSIGITGTPVIDPISGIVYIEARTREATVSTTNYVHRLHALSITNGAEMPGSPVVIAANNYLGTGGTGSNITSDGVTYFLPDTDGAGHVLWSGLHEQNRPGLTLVNGKVYIAYAQPGDILPWHGWMFAYDATTFAQTGVICLSPNGNAGGIWQGGGAPVADTNGNIFVNTGNGTFNNVSNNYGDAYVRFSTTNGLQLVDYFTPSNTSALNNADLDVSSAGLLLLPDSVGSAANRHLLVGGSKNGNVFLMNTTNLGGWSGSASSPDLVVQELANVGGGPQIFTSPAYFNGLIYWAAANDVLRAFSISNATMSTSSVTQSSAGFSGGSTPTISAHGTSNGVVWAYAYSGTPVLRAYNATNLTTELYDSQLLSARDGLGNGNGLRFTIPTVVNGKVYVPLKAGVAVFGSSIFMPTPVISPNGGIFTNSQTVTLSNSYPGSSMYYTLDGTTPTTSSLLYTNPFVLTHSVLVSAITTLVGASNSGVATASFINSAELGSGTGLTGMYWSNTTSTNFTNSSFTNPPSFTRIDSNINFNWSNNPPTNTMSQTNFVVRWTGSIQPLYNETYTIAASSDDGERVWVNGQLLINQWVNRNLTTNSFSIPMRAQQLYTIQMDYFQANSNSEAHLYWSSPSTPTNIIPQSQLYPYTNPPPAVALIAPTNGATYTANASVTMDATAAAQYNTISNVSFYASGMLLGTLTNSPYVLTTTILPVGAYSLTAVATDSTGVTNTSSTVNITVNSSTGQPRGLASRPTTPAFYNLPTVIPANLPGNLPLTLSATGVFADVPSLSPATGLIPYGPNTPLWSDNASKSRWLAVPYAGGNITPDQQITFAPTGEWLFPGGTVFVKHFSLTVNETDTNVPQRRLETRLLVRDTNGAVYGVTYKWRSDNSDADLLTGSLNEDIVITNASGTRTQTWYYPSPTDCLVCHTPAASYVLGVKTRQLNGNFTYPSTGVTDNQLRALNYLGLFNPAFDEAGISNYAQLVSVSNNLADVTNRFRSYIDANCAQCHRPGGTGGEAMFDARYDTPLTNQGIVNGTAVGSLGYDNAHIVTPKDIWRSVLYDRANSTDPSIKMPPLARNLVDSNAMTVVAAFINSLPGTPALAPPVFQPSGGAFNASVSVTLQPPDTNAALYYTLNGTLPTTNSTHYTGPFVLTNNLVTVEANAFENGYNNSVAATAVFTIYPDRLAGTVSNGVFVLPFTAAPNKTYILYATTDFVSWTPISTNTPLSSPFYLMDTNSAAYPRRFYRAVQLP